MFTFISIYRKQLLDCIPSQNRKFRLNKDQVRLSLMHSKIINNPNQAVAEPFLAQPQLVIFWVGVWLKNCSVPNHID